MEKQEHNFLEISMVFKNKKAAHKYVDAQRFEKGSELDIGLGNQRLLTACGAGCMNNLDDDKIELLIDGWLQLPINNVEDTRKVLINLINLTSKPLMESIEIYSQDNKNGYRSLFSWSADDEDSFRIATLPEAFYDGINYALFDMDHELDAGKKLLKRALREFSPYNKVRYYRLLNIKMGYMP
jgi:hypothetical protein